MHQITHCSDVKGKSPVEEFIDSLRPKTRAKVFGQFELLKEHGPMFGMFFSGHLGDRIFELRTVQGNDIARYCASSSKVVAANRK